MNLKVLFRWLLLGGMVAAFVFCDSEVPDHPQRYWWFGHPNPSKEALARQIALRHLEVQSYSRIDHAVGSTINRQTIFTYRRLAALRKGAQNAERIGDYNQAITLYERELSISRISLDRVKLAELYVRVDRIKDAAEQYRWLVKPPSQVITSYSVRPKYLARYGELSLASGNKVEAYWGYEEAARHCYQYLGKGLVPDNVGFKLDGSESFDDVEAAGLFSSGVEKLSEANINAARLDLERALGAQPKSPLFRFAYALCLDRFPNSYEEAKAQRWKAEQYATGSLRERIHEWRTVKPDIVLERAYRYDAKQCRL